MIVEPFETLSSRVGHWADRVGIATNRVLKGLRLNIAKERGVPAFAVFHDRALRDMVRRRPRSLDAFAEIHGVGAAKLGQFAGPFIDFIANHTG